MFKTNGKRGILLIVCIIVALTAPLISWGAGDTGKDWYCSEPEAHTGDYKKHLALHIQNEADQIAARLEYIYDNQSLTPKEKHAKTIAVLNRYLLQVKAGIGD